MSRTLKIQIDGAARGNPGPAGIGIVLSEGVGHRVKEISLYLGEATNNVAETCALIVALQQALAMGFQQVEVFTDSELLAKQVTGDYRVKDKQLRWLHVLIRNLTGSFTKFKIQHQPREKNRQADRLANRAVDDGLKKTAAPRRTRKTSSAQTESQQPTFW